MPVCDLWQNLLEIRSARTQVRLMADRTIWFCTSVYRGNDSAFGRSHTAHLSFQQSPVFPSAKLDSDEICHMYAYIRIFAQSVCSVNSGQYLVGMHVCT